MHPLHAVCLIITQGCMQIEQALNSGNFHIFKPRKALNKAFLKLKPNRTQIGAFKGNLNKLQDRTNDTESQEFYKNSGEDLLKKTWYKPNHIVNTVKAEIERHGCWFYGLMEEEIVIVESS